MLAFGMLPVLPAHEVVRIAALANLELDAAEVELFARQLGEILAYADQVQQIDVAGVAPTASVVTRHTVDRADVVQPCLDRDEVLEGAPDPARGAGLFRVPKVIG